MPTIRQIERAESGLIPSLTTLLQDAVHRGASVGFLAPLSWQTASAYWTQIMDNLGDGLRLWVAEADSEVLGTVQLAPCLKENGRHRADLQKLLVHSRHRGQKIASALMAAAEASAIQSNVSLLVLDTLRDSAAEGVYTHLGWQRGGEIPDYAAEPDGTLRPTVYYFKMLPTKPALSRQPQS